MYKSSTNSGWFLLCTGVSATLSWGDFGEEEEEDEDSEMAAVVSGLASSEHPPYTLLVLHSHTSVLYFLCCALSLMTE